MDVLHAYESGHGFGLYNLKSLGFSKWKGSSIGDVKSLGLVTDLNRTQNSLHVKI